jgi:hypothetical protein
MDYYKLNERYLETKQYKDRWLALYQDLYNLVLIDRDAFNVKFNYIDVGKPTANQVWDSTAVIAAYQRANDLHGLLLPKDRSWGKYKLDSHMYPQDFIDSKAELIDEINENILFRINESNLNRCVSGSLEDLNGGTGALWVESHSDDVPIFFRSIPAVATYIEYSTDDLVENGWYQCKMTGREVLENFPQYRGHTYTALLAQPNNYFTLVYGQVKEALDKYNIYACLEADPFVPLFEAERRYRQLIVFRDRVRPGEAEGRGIALDMMPMIRDLNKIVQYDRQSMAFKAYPPMFVNSDSYFNPYQVRQWAGALIQRNPNQQKNPMEAMQMPDSPERILQLQNMINKAFMVEPLGEITEPVKTATEVSIRENRAQRTASVDISRLINELPKQIFDVCATILAERRLLTRDRSVSKIMTHKLKFVFESPLYDNEKQDKLSHFITNMQVKQQFFGEEVAMATADLGECVDFLTDVTNLPHKLFKNKAAMQQAIGAMGQAQAQQMQDANAPKPTTGALPVPAQSPSQVQI